ncbi:hypothetical protein BG004_000179 [Podila humilis]|nr:hypothetical protein BG004_000179 [Podila humilis]
MAEVDAPEPLPVKNLIQALKECPESEIADHVQSTPEWIWPRGDLFHWVGVLNRFDEILDTICKSHDMKTACPKPFSPDNQRLIYAILTFSRLLLESCTNRNLYASYEQLNDLLHSRDLDILEACLRLLLRPAQRHSAQRSARSIFTVSQDRLLAIAHSWGSKDFGLDLVQLAENNTDIPERLSALNFQFYRTISIPTQAGAAPSSSSTQSSSIAQPSTATPSASSLPATGSAASTSSSAATALSTSISSTTTSVQTSPSKRRASRSGISSAPGPITDTNTAQSTAAEGMVVIHAVDPSTLGQTDDEILARFIQEYHIPEEHQFQIMCRIRVATGIRHPERRRQLLTIRLLAIAVMAHVLPESVVLDKFLAFEPEILQSLTDVIHPDNNMPFNLQTVALFALDGLAHLRGKQPDMLTAINASASHGVLLYSLRKIMAGLDSDIVQYPQEFLDAMFAFLSFIISFNTGGNMVVSAGLVPILLQLLSNKRASQLKNVTKAITVLDSLIYGFGTAFTSFCSSNGINLLVGRMKDDVEYSLSIVKEAENQKMTGVTETSESTVKEEDVSPVPFEQTALLKAMFKFVHHMMQSPGTQEGLRNLIDTSLPATLKVIMENPSALGTSVYAHAINTMTSFIHNEPTSLAILQEAKIPQTLLSSLSKDIPASTDVVTSIPGAFGALCLNAPGLEMMNKEFEMKKLFDIFTSLPHVRAFQESDINSNIGVSMDELVRHQPTLKAGVMKEIKVMLNAVLQKCSLEEVSSEEMVFCTLQKTRAVDAPRMGVDSEDDETKDDRNSLVAQLIEGAARFCESFFQNTSNARDFLKDDGVLLLMKFYWLPTLPYDLANTPAFFTLSHLLKLLSETNPAVAVSAVVNEVNRRLTTVRGLLESQNSGSELIKYINIANLSASEVEEGNLILRSLISLHALSGLLSDMYCAPAFSHGRNSASVLTAFATPDGDAALSGLGQLHRMCVWECIAMKRVLQKRWNDPNPKAKKLLNNPVIPGTVEDGVEESTASVDNEMSTDGMPENDMYSPTAINTKYFKFVLTQIPHYLTPMYQGITKMLIVRREMEPGHRTNAFKIADSLTRVLQSHINWTRINACESEVDKSTYLHTMLQLIPFLLLDGRNPRTLQTIVDVSFVRTNGLNALFTLFEAIWSKAKGFSLADATQETPEKAIVAKLHSMNQIILNVLQTITSSTLLMDSSHTTTLTSRDDKNRDADYFEPHEFMVATRLTVLPMIRKVWEDDHLKQCPASLIQQVIHIFIHILKAEGELRHMTPTAAPVVIGATQSLFGARPIVPDAASVTTLLDMGFPRAAAELALTRCGNQIDRAAEYLLTHQEIVQAAFYDQEREEAAARAAASTGPSTATTADAEAPVDATAATSTDPPAEPPAVGEQAEHPHDNNDDDSSDDSEQEDDDDDEDEEEDEAAMLQQALEMSVAGDNDGVSQSTNESSDPSQANAAGGSRSTTRPSTAAGSSTPVASTSTATAEKPDANKIALEKYKAQKEELTKMREELSPLLVPRALGLMQFVDEIVFVVRDLIVLQCRKKESRIMDQLVEDTQQFANMDESATEEKKKIFGTHLRLLALLFADPAIQPKMENFASVLIPMLMATLVKSGVPQKDNPWLSPLLLMMEGFISLSDEPKVVPDETSPEGKAKAEQQDKEMQEDIVSLADMETLLNYCFSLLKQDTLVKDVVLSVFRILVRLTRHHNLAVEFLKADGLPLIFSTLKPERLGVRGQQSMLVMIMRHIIEDTQVLQATMEKEIHRWFSQPTRGRGIDIPFYLRHNTFLGMRNHEAFIAGTLNVCKVAKYDANFKTLQLALAKTETASKSDDKKEGDSAADGKNKEQSQASAAGESPVSASVAIPVAVSNASAFADATKKYSSEVSEAVIHFLVTELLSCRSHTALPGATATTTSPTKAEASITAQEQTKAVAVTSTPNASGIATTTDKPAEPAFDADFVHSCFLLQCLHELLISYPACKVDLMNYSRRKGNKAATQGASKPNANWLAYLLNDLIPYRGTVAQSSNTDLRKHSIESNFASSVLVAMCSNSDDEEEKKPFSELVQVRRFVVDGIIRSFKDAIASTDPVELKYGKFLSLSELSFKILSASSTTGSTAKPSEDMSINIVKVMLEKNFILTLTNVLSDIDLNYPHAKILANAVLKPLEHLTKLSLKMGRASEPGTAKPRRRSTPLSATASGNGSGDDAPDLYRNSSLGMFDGANIESEEEHESDDSMGEEDIFDEDEYDEETASDASDLSEEGLSDEEEDEEAAGENTPRNPFHRHETSDEENDDEPMEDDEDDDEDMDAELQEALEHEEEDDEAMEGAMDWDQPTHRPVMLDDDEIGEVIGDDDDDVDDDDQSEHGDFYDGPEHIHIHIRRHQNQPHDDEAAEEDGEDVDEDEEEDEDDDQDDDEEDEENGIDNMDLEEAGEFFQLAGHPGHHHGHHGPMTHTFVINDNDILRNGAMGLNLRGRHPRLARRRLDDRGFIWNEADSDQGRMANLEDDHFTALDAPARNPYIQGSDDVTTHPLLAAPPPTGVAGVPENRPRTGSRNLGLTDWHTFEELLNENTSQVLSNLFNGGSFRGGHGTFRVEVNHGNTTTLIPIERDGPRVIIPGESGFMNASQSRHQPDGTSPSNKDDMFSIVQEFVPYSTAQRWSQESRMMYGLTLQDKAVRLANHIVNALIPAAKEEARMKAERDAKELELRRKAEAERKQMADEKRKAEEEAERAKAEEAEKARLEEEAAAAEREAARLAERAANGVPEESSEDTAMDVEEAPTAEVDTSNVPAITDTEPAEAAEPPLRMVMIDGDMVDITDSDIDPEFLEALPEDMRREVYNDYLQSHRPRAPPTPAAAATSAAANAGAINDDFLDALPQNMRTELDELIRGQRVGARDALPDVNSYADLTSTLNEYAASLSRMMPQMRQFGQNPAIANVADATALLSQLPRHFPGLSRNARDILAGAGSGGAGSSSNGATGLSSKKPLVQREAIQLVDKSSLATLVRLMFLPQPLSKNILNKLLVNLCENSKTRTELLSLLLSILQDGGADLAAVDKSFAQMSLRGKPFSKSGHKGKGTSTISTSPTISASSDHVPNLVARRCLESLHYIVAYNSQAAIYFLSEHENVTLKKPTKKGKGKEKVSSSKYPIVLLLDLLERPIFVQHSALMEQLMNLLSVICRPLATLSTNVSEEAIKETEETSVAATSAPQEESAATTTTATLVPTNTTDTTTPTTTSGTTSARNQETGATGAASTSTQPATNEAAINAPAAESSTTTSSSAPDAKTENKAAEPEAPALKPPVIPDHYLQLVVRVLTAGECSSKTFQHTLSVIQNLSILEGARDVITAELTSASRELGSEILDNLDTLAKTLERAMSGVDVQGSALEKFSPASSNQAKLLRVLKTIDYMYSRKQTPQMPASTQVNIELAPTLDPEEADAVLPRSMRDIKSGLINLNKDEEKVTEIYDNLSFNKLWTKVGDTLELIHEKSDMIHVATVLLPLIESFMVVCKYVGLRPSTLEMEEDLCKATSNSTEELFLQFTDKHSKILNIMVRNNPALMSGSFSLLVHNPKMLEFDNKRNYFTQQLHKRGGARDHYGTLQMNVRREMVFVDSFNHWQSKKGDEIKYSKLNVKFHGEEGVDAGGVTREWFQVLARQMFNPDYALFKTSAADKLTYQPNRASWANSEHLLFFKFIGRVIGKAIYDGRLLDAYFTRSFYKHILGRPVDYRDVEAVDPEYYKSLVWMLENDITNIVDETFSVETDDFGTTKTVDLKPGGRDIPVTEENKHEYVKYITEQKLTLAIKDQIHSFLQGFHEIIPGHLISIFNEQELELLISGLPDIDVDEWKNCTEYQNYSPGSPQVQYFWRAVRSFDQTERAKLLQFVTGTSKVPLGGFAQLQGISGVQKFQIHKDFSSTKRLPSAHTCFNQLDLPEYETYEELRQQLLTAISECSTGFAFA